MNTRLKLPNKEQKNCTNKMADSSEIAGEGVNETEIVEEEESDAEVKSSAEKAIDTQVPVLDVEEIQVCPKKSDDQESSVNDGDNSESDSEEANTVKNNLDSNLEASNVQKDSKENSNSKDREKSIDPNEKHKDLESSNTDLPNNDEIKEQSENSTASNKSEDEKSTSVSKLGADALSASLSSSRCLLKRNRDDLESDDDSEEEEEEPYSKKSHIGEITPKFVSKLKNTELLASMSSSNKSLLKRGIEKVDKANSEESTDAPESKKSNLSQTPKSEDHKSTCSLETTSEAVKEDRLSHDKTDVTQDLDISPHHVKIVAKTLKFPPKSPDCQNQVLNTESSTRSPPKSENARTVLKEEEPKEEVKQKIGAKELAGQRQLERKRLNKMLSIFDDQKRVK